MRILAQVLSKQKQNLGPCS